MTEQSRRNCIVRPSSTSQQSLNKWRRWGRGTKYELMKEIIDSLASARAGQPPLSSMCSREPRAGSMFLQREQKPSLLVGSQCLVKSLHPSSARQELGLNDGFGDLVLRTATGWKNWMGFGKWHKWRFKIFEGRQQWSLATELGFPVFNDSRLYSGLKHSLGGRVVKECDRVGEWVLKKGGLNLVEPRLRSSSGENISCMVGEGVVTLL